MQRSPPAISRRNFNFSQLYTGLRRVSPAQIFLGKLPEWCRFYREKQLPGFRSSPIWAFPQFCLPLWWRRQLCDTVNASNTFLTWANTAILICFLSTFLSWNNHRLTGICRKGVQEAPYTLHPLQQHQHLTDLDCNISIMMLALERSIELTECSPGIHTCMCMWVVLFLKKKHITKIETQSSSSSTDFLAFSLETSLFWDHNPWQSNQFSNLICSYRLVILRRLYKRNTVCTFLKLA